MQRCFYSLIRIYLNVCYCVCICLTHTCVFICIYILKCSNVILISTHAYIHTLIHNIYIQVVTNPSVLPRILNQLITTETLAPGSISADKLGFRLRLIGGAVREATGEVLLQCIEQVYVLTGTVYTQHSEKSVRKAANKLAKVIII